jgi:hypothetical protein
VNEQSSERKTVIVLGAARSGTSVTAGLLASLGIDMGSVGYPTRSNPRGAFEDRDFERLHKEIFTAVGQGKSYWDPPRREEILRQQALFAPRIERLIFEKSKGKRLWGWKHPRTILTIDLFLPYLVNPYFVIVLRNPLSTALSSVEHTGEKVDFLTALKLENFYQTEMLHFLETHPELPKVFVSFEDLVTHSTREAARLADFLGVELDREKAMKVERIVISRDEIESRKRRAKGLLTGIIPNFFRKTISSILGTRKRVDV